MPSYPIEATEARIQYTATGGQTVFPYNFPIFDEDHLVVQRTRSGATTILTITTDYTVSGVNVETGGNVTLVTGATAGDILTIYRKVPLQRLTDYQTAGDFEADTVNQDFDLLWMALQDSARDGNRSLRLQATDDTDPDAFVVPLKADRASTYLGFDANGLPIPVTAAVGGAVVTPFMETLLDDPDGSTARSTLGLGALAVLDTAPIPDASVGALQLASAAFGFTLINGYVDASVSGNAMTLAIKTLAGTDPSASDPVKVLIRSATATSGLPTIMSITAATSLVVSSGSTLNAPGSNEPFPLWVVGFNDAGTFRLGIMNCTTLASGALVQYPLAGFGIASSTAEGGAGAADSAQTFYTGTAVTSKPYTVLCRLSFETGLATAGAWASAPTRVDMFHAGMPLPGTAFNRQHSINGAVATGTTVIPFDDTQPQSGEGDQYYSAAITPSSAANLVAYDAKLSCTVASGGFMITAVFKDAVAGALSVAVTYPNGGAAYAECRNRNTIRAGSTAAQTFKLRAGPAAANTLTVNGRSGSRDFGGYLVSGIEICEIVA